MMPQFAFNKYAVLTDGNPLAGNWGYSNPSPGAKTIQPWMNGYGISAKQPYIVSKKFTLPSGDRKYRARIRIKGDDFAYLYINRYTQNIAVARVTMIPVGTYNLPGGDSDQWWENNPTANCTYIGWNNPAAEILLEETTSGQYFTPGGENRIDIETINSGGGSGIMFEMIIEEILENPS